MKYIEFEIKGYYNLNIHNFNLKKCAFQFLEYLLKDEDHNVMLSNGTKSA